ncbi:MAG: thioesterase, partial [Kiritimatiellia bacterium]
LVESVAALCYSIRMEFTEENAPLHVLTEEFRITADECLTGLQASLPALTNFLQEIAAVHADALGIGLQTLQEAGFTWMLGRLSVRLWSVPRWNDSVKVTTWPSGARGRLRAERQFVMESMTGERLLEASSEWLYVDFKAQRLAKLPDAILALSRAGSMAFGLCEARLGTVPPEAPLIAEATFPVRRSEIDANLHVNNVHYTEWMRETLPEERFFAGVPKLYEIEYQQAAKWGDVVTARTYDLGASIYAHTVTRADGVSLARARTVY